MKAETYVKIFAREMRESLGAKTTITDKLLKVAMKVCDKRLRELDDLIDDPSAFIDLVTEDEWKILGADELNIDTLAKKKHDEWLSKNEVMQAEKRKQEQSQKTKKKKKPKVKKEVNGE